MAEVFAQAPVRDGVEGVKDKAAIIDALARRVATYDRAFIDKVREIVKPAGNPADAKVRLWFDHCCKLVYTRERGEVFAHPLKVLESGGDCDDLVILFLAGCHVMAIPCCSDVVTRNGDGIHIRARVGLPPTNPPADMTQWEAFDPVEVSERQWAMVPADAPKPTLGKSVGVGGLAGLQWPSDPKVAWTVTGLLAGAGAVLLWSRARRKRRGRP